jgi:phosphorylase/glycogen(starch) synthase
VFSVKVPDIAKSRLSMGENFIAEIVLDINDLSIDDLAVQILFTQKANGSVDEILYKENLKVKSRDDSVITYRCDIPVTRAGLFDYIFRVIPVNPLLQYPEDSGIFLWL